MPIRILPPQLANQIAAGEVVERPASVVKELIENSLDAGATQLDIVVEQGGMKSIRLRDNGCGIAQEELALALARHGTSKITSIDDLNAIQTLGFRGEALASMSAVSRLTLTSRPAEQQEAWQAHAEGRDMQVTVKPAAHPVGTTIEVADLFYNTPARRRFMRTEKTEFAHIDEVVRRIALTRFDVAISLTHNDKRVRQYRVASDEAQRLRRLNAICGSAFSAHAVQIDWQHEELSLSGWVTAPTWSRQQMELQYCYVNGRVTRDKLLNHAIRQAYQTQLIERQLPAWVLYLHIEPNQVDVNVHPTKQEVRFHQSRLVHDFVFQGVASALQTMKESNAEDYCREAEASSFGVNGPAAGHNQFARQSAPRSIKPNNYANLGAERYNHREGAVYQQMVAPAAIPTVHTDCETASLSIQQASFGRLLTVLQQRYALLEKEDKLWLMVLQHAQQHILQAQLQPTQGEKCKAQPLLIPLRFKLNKKERDAVLSHAELLQQLGIELSIEGHGAIVNAVPLPLRKQNLQQLFPDILAYLTQHNAPTMRDLVSWLSYRSDQLKTDWNYTQVVQLLAELERLCPDLVKTPPSGLLAEVDIDKLLGELPHASSTK